MLASWDSGACHQPTFRIQGIRIISPRKSGQTDGEKRWWHLVAGDSDPSCSFPLAYGRKEAVNNSFLTKKESKQRKKSKHKQIAKQFCLRILQMIGLSFYTEHSFGNISNWIPLLWRTYKTDLLQAYKRLYDVCVCLFIGT